MALDGSMCHHKLWSRLASLQEGTEATSPGWMEAENIPQPSAHRLPCWGSQTLGFRVKLCPSQAGKLTFPFSFCECHRFLSGNTPRARSSKSLRRPHHPTLLPLRVFPQGKGFCWSCEHSLRATAAEQGRINRAFVSVNKECLNNTRVQPSWK